ncbi:rRNA pseudouridine synthase [Sulfurimonas crateris]|uniref:Pseudouridine synthase n=1 Tax=Sulfurimonas crateris TaxID=2574727 RepID=A0A4U2ZCW5_9BACT|nr:pseudouridine synthase [Sulfurimonas crateris]TKI71051.1 rRNA pseudouridine synthase [Sulfurimonas crateris]
MVRLNKYIAHHSSYSRREADKAIQDGYVRVDGEIQTNPATDVIEGVNIIYVSGKQVSPRDKYTVIVYNKPKGELVTKSDPKGRKTIYDSLSKEYKHYIPVGRLDYASEGVLLLTDASKVASALMESDLERIYKIKIKGEVTPDMEDAMLKGMTLDDASAGGHSHSKVMAMEFKPFIGYKIQKNQPNYSILKVALSEGKNRELRRFFAHFGAEVVDLKRISFAEIELNNLPEGKVRFLSRSEYSALAKFLKDEKKSEQKEFKGSEKRSFKKDESKNFSKDNKKPAVKSKKPTKKK